MRHRGEMSHRQAGGRDLQGQEGRRKGLQAEMGGEDARPKPPASPPHTLTAPSRWMLGRPLSERQSRPKPLPTLPLSKPTGRPPRRGRQRRR